MNKIILFVLLVIAIAACSPQSISGDLPEIDPGIDSNSWANIESGEFLLGQHEHESDIDYDFEIMITLVTNGQFAEFLNSSRVDGFIGFNGANPVGYYPGDVFRGFRHEEEISEGNYMLAALDDPGSRLQLVGQSYESKSIYGNHPATLVTWFGAKAYCEYYGWRLPLETEWEKAARGTDNRPFPWGHSIKKENANYYSSHDIFEKFAGKSDTTPVGFYNGGTYQGFKTEDSPSPYGLYDMAGNVWQWTGDVYEDQHYRYMRGGSKENYAYNLRVWTRNSASPTYFSPNVGFRCAR
jgi:formylglycine-generating enzyme required for sulfatase activity